MAGEWIKMELSTPDKPEVLRMARILEIDKDAVIGKLFRVWAWFDKNTVDGHVDGVVSTDVDGIAVNVGFCSAMKQVGWFEFNDEEQWVRLINFDRHNGETAKNRALKNKRQSKWRSNVDAKPSTETSTQQSTETSTREEKRRDKDIAYKSVGFCFKTALLEAGGNPDLVTDWLKVRSKLKATNTKSAFALFMGQVARAGYTVNQALEVCCSRSWKGFDAAWVKDAKPAEPDKPKFDTSIEARRAAMQVQADESFKDRQWLEGERRYRTVVTIEGGEIKRTKHYLESVASA